MPDKKQGGFFPLKSVMTREVVYVHPETPIFEAIRLLPKHRISGLPVVDVDMKLIGILTEKDVIGILIKEHIDYNATVADFMTRDVVAFKEEDSAIELCRFFLNNPIRRVPIVKDGKLIGVVSRRDLLTLILEAKSNFSSFRFD